MSLEQVIHRYMNGQCHALAFVLSNILSKPVGILYAVRDGETPIPDPLHVYVMLSEGYVLDVKGQRSKEVMARDFHNVLALLKRSEADQLTHHYEEVLDSDDLYHELGFDPSWIRKAEIDLAGGLWDRLEFEGKPALDPKTIVGMNLDKDFDADSSYGF
jgi:hypothetical protein